MGDFLNLEGRIAVVTGGARGIGLAITRALIDHGVRVHVFDVAPGAGDDAAPYSFHQADIADSASVAKAVAGLPAGVSLLVNNAGITRDRSAVNMSDDEWDAVLSVNLTGAFRMIRALAPMMRKAGYGRIVNITSINGIRGKFGQANYAASKAGLIGFTKAVARELASRNVLVNAIAPGFIETDMTRALTDAQRDTLRAQIPLGRLGQPEDIARAVVFLASDQADYITGQVLVVDGGMVM
jgi:3-oxoacyl-[acyl-carrier protein] reductase